MTYIKNLTLILTFMLTVGCVGGKAIYIQGDKGANATIEVSMTGGRVSLQGPFKYCSEPVIADSDNDILIPDSVCAAILGE